jgi:hypothetical protein
MMGCALRQGLIIRPSAKCAAVRTRHANSAFPNGEGIALGCWQIAIAHYFRREIRNAENQP